MLLRSNKMVSAVRNASGITIRRIALCQLEHKGQTYLSSRVRSIHWTALVPKVCETHPIKYRDSEQIRSQRMGFRLYAMAEDPICPGSRGSSISLRLARRRMSVAILWAVLPREESG